MFLSKGFCYSNIKKCYKLDLLKIFFLSKNLLVVVQSKHSVVVARKKR